jgi:RNA polymerase sigma-70 factor, ECF subfamily
LLQIARFTCADDVRRRTRARSLLERVRRDAPPEAEPPSGLLEVDDAIAGLERDRREAFVLTQVTGLSYAEAAAVCEVPIGTIRSRVARARAELLAALTDGADVTSGAS